MIFPNRYSELSGYPFPRLRELLNATQEPKTGLRLSLGEPQHKFPDFISKEIDSNAALFNNYPKNNGEPKLLDAIKGYATRSLMLENIAHNMITPLNGTREGLFMSALTLLPKEKNGKPPLIIAPNPFYQVYMMGAHTLGHEIKFLNCGKQTNFLPDLKSVDAATWERCTIFFICSPGNPHGKIADREYLTKLLKLAEKHNFFVFSDECYHEIYFNEKPNSAFKIAQEIGIDPNRVVIFHSLSKRSNAPGLRSGFLITGEETNAYIQKLRRYAGAPLPTPIQLASAKLWNDDQHVDENRKLYADKMAYVADVLGAEHVPDGGFFLWLPVENDEECTKELWKHDSIEVLPGSYLAQTTPQGNPGRHYVRVAMVAPRELTNQAVDKIKKFIKEY